MNAPSLDPYFRAASARTGLGENFLRAMAMGESRGQAGAVGPMTRYGFRALGPMQMAPATYAEQAGRMGLGADPMNPADNIMAGAGYLKQLIGQFGPDLEKVLLAWNAGPGYAQRYEAGKADYPDETRKLYGRVTGYLAGGMGKGDPVIPVAARPPAKPVIESPPAGLVSGDGSEGVTGLAGNGQPAPQPPSQPGPERPGLDRNDYLLAGAVQGIAPYMGWHNRPVSFGQALAGLANGLTQGEMAARAASRQDRADALSGLETRVKLAELAGKADERQRQRAGAEAYASRLEAAGHGDLAAAVRNNPALMDEIVKSQAAAAFPKDGKGTGTLFGGTSIEGQALNHMVSNGMITPQQALTWAAGKAVTGPNGQLDFLTPQSAGSTSPGGAAPSGGPAGVPAGMQTIRPGQFAPQDKEAIREADDVANAAGGVIRSLDDALRLNDTAFSGATANERAWLARNLGIAKEGGEATTMMNTILGEQALGQLKIIFGANPTEGERRILMDLQASVEKSPEERRAIIERARSVAEQRLASSQARAKALRDGTYYTQGVPAVAAGGAASSPASAASADTRPRARNPQTGEEMVFDGQAWVKP